MWGYQKSPIVFYVYSQVSHTLKHCWDIKISFCFKTSGGKSFNHFHRQTSANRTNLGRVFNFRNGHIHDDTFLVLSVKLPNLQQKTQPKKLLGYLMLVIALPTIIKLCIKIDIYGSVRQLLSHTGI